MRFLGFLLLYLAAAGMPDFIRSVRQHTGPGGDLHELSGMAAFVVLDVGGGITLIARGRQRADAR
jgi:hypothetical protein